MKFLLFFGLLASSSFAGAESKDASPKEVGVGQPKKVLAASTLLNKSGREVKASRFHGYLREDFVFEEENGKGRKAILVSPNEIAEGRPWIWRARFFGHQPALDLELLEQGWHVAYVDVSNLYGSPQAIEIWDRFYEFSSGHLGLSKKPVLEGMSRGGLIVFHWAMQHPNQVSAIYGDNPVCDFRTWPAGIKQGKRSEKDWNKLLKAWNLEEKVALESTPILDGLKSLAQKKVPVTLVLGTADEVVPPQANGEMVVKAYEALGAPFKVWRKEGAGHHPHGLEPTTPLRTQLERWFEASLQDES